MSVLGGLAMTLGLAWAAPGGSRVASLTAFGAMADDAIDDAPAMSQAIASGAHEVRVPAGRYVLRDLRAIRLRSSLTIRCDPGAELVVPEDAVTHEQRSAQGYVYKPLFGVPKGAASVHDFVLAGCRIVVEARDVTPVFIDSEGSTGVVVARTVIDGKGSRSTSAAGFGVVINRGTGFRIQDSDIAYTRYGGLMLRLGARCSVERNRIAFAGVEPDYPFDAPATATQGVHYRNAAGVAIPGAAECRLADNAISYTGGTGLILRGGGNDCRDNEVVGNVLSHIGKGGIGIGINTGGTGSSRRNRVLRNVIRGYAERRPDAAINVNHRGRSGTVEDIEILENVIEHQGAQGAPQPMGRALVGKRVAPQIVVRAPAAGAAARVRIQGNRLVAGDRVAVWLERGADSAVADNEIWVSGTPAVAVAGSQVSVTGNRIVDCRHGQPQGEYVRRMGRPQDGQVVVSANQVLGRTSECGEISMGGAGGPP